MDACSLHRGAVFWHFNFIAATLYVSLVAMVLAVTVGLGAAIYLSCVATPADAGILYPFVDLFWESHP